MRMYVAQLLTSVVDANESLKDRKGHAYVVEISCGGLVGVKY